MKRLEDPLATVFGNAGAAVRDRDSAIESHMHSHLSLSSTMRDGVLHEVYEGALQRAVVAGDNEFFHVAVEGWFVTASDRQRREVCHHLAPERDEIDSSEWALLLLQTLQIENLPEPGLHRIWFDRGTIDLDSMYGPTHDRLKAGLLSRGYVEGQDLEARVYEETGHFETWWQARLPEVLTFLLKGRAA